MWACREMPTANATLLELRRVEHVAPLRQPVSVSVSTTFHDMHAQRDRLVFFVFPRLREGWPEDMG